MLCHSDVYLANLHSEIKPSGTDLSSRAVGSRIIPTGRSSGLICSPANAQQVVNSGHGMLFLICGMMDIKDPLLLNKCERKIAQTMMAMVISNKYTDSEKLS